MLGVAQSFSLRRMPWGYAEACGEKPHFRVARGWRIALTGSMAADSRQQSISTLRYWHGRLPHWEVEGGRYFVTVRCGDSLPQEAVARIEEIQASIAQTPPASPQFATYQRQLFRTLEKYLDAGLGACPLRSESAAAAVVAVLTEAPAHGAAVPHFTIMSNHWHALIVPETAAFELRKFMQWLKGASARRVNQSEVRTGSLWQREWFDRWIRDESEWERTVEYIRLNPVKARLVKEWTAHPFTR